MTGEPPSDELPDDLDVTRGAGPAAFPDTRRRGLLGALYLAVAAGAGASAAAFGNSGLIGAVVLLALVGTHHLLAAWPLRVTDTEALATAARAVGFPVGHASAQLVFRGLRSRPTWRLLLYSADDPPSKRGLVELDAVDGGVLGQFSEDNPEDWSQYG